MIPGDRYIASNSNFKKYYTFLPYLRKYIVQISLNNQAQDLNLNKGSV